MVQFPAGYGYGTYVFTADAEHQQHVLDISPWLTPQEFYEYTSKDRIFKKYVYSILTSEGDILVISDAEKFNIERATKLIFEVFEEKFYKPETLIEFEELFGGEICR